MSENRTWRTRVSKNTRTEVMASPETRRKRTRSAALRDAIQQFEDDFEDAIDIFDGDDLDHDPV